MNYPLLLIREYVCGKKPRALLNIHNRSMYTLAAARRLYPDVTSTSNRQQRVNLLTMEQTFAKRSSRIYRRMQKFAAAKRFSKLNECQHGETDQKH